ncbi:radical SAM family heme chaperone HemW [Barrientosiimonas marina]|uniref:Heme chaperone HemW n=1 Tax=Lentibacillus kimchii TaxID=1542911 RepID=A0ABW2UW23_9BACI
MEAQSVYIHIPFCQQICYYCDFNKAFYKEKQATDYIEALAQEMNTQVPGLNNPVKTIYIGGGTPTALTIYQMRSLLQVISSKFDVSSCSEFTIEGNPGDFNSDMIELLKSYGVSRISLGVQVFDDAFLKEIGRLHTVSDVYRTLDSLQQHHFNNISLDLIYALPNQTVEHFRQTLDEAVAFDLPHYSAYALQIEPKTAFYRRYKKGKLHRPPQEEEVEMYHILKKTMRHLGTRQYEISNFAKPGFESQHNLVYWDNEYYYGFGAGAHGYLPGKRVSNIGPLPDYVQKAMEDGKPVVHTEEIGLKEMIEEEMFLGLRKTEGVNADRFMSRYGFSLETLFNDALAFLSKKGWLQQNGNNLQLTDKGMLFGDDVFEQFLLDEQELEHVR